jgi:putative peptidoglycan lipid II flippase
MKTSRSPVRVAGTWSMLFLPVKLNLFHRITRSQSARSSIVVICLSILSPATGLLAEMSLAQWFGSSRTTDAYRVCSLFVVFTQQALMLQLLPAVLVPLFAGARARGTAREGWTAAAAMMAAIAILAGGAMAIVWAKPSVVTQIFAPQASSALKADIETMVIYTVVAVAFIGMSAVITGILMAHRVYHVPWTSQIASNLFFVLFLRFHAKTASLHDLALGTAVSAVIVFLVHIICIARLWRSERPTRVFSARRLRGFALLIETFYLSIPAVLILAVQQLATVFINRSLISGPIGDAASFGYAWKLQIFVAVIPFSITTVYFPILAAYRADGDISGVIRITQRLILITAVVACITVPALFVFHYPLTSILFRRGRMSPQAVTEIAALYAVLLLGAVPSSLLAVCNRICLALRLPLPSLGVAGCSTLAMILLLPLAHSTRGALGVASLIAALSWLTGISIVILLWVTIHKAAICATAGSRPQIRLNSEALAERPSR